MESEQPSDVEGRMSWTRHHPVPARLAIAASIAAPVCILSVLFMPSVSKSSICGGWTIEISILSVEILNASDSGIAEEIEASEHERWLRFPDAYVESDGTVILIGEIYIENAGR